MLAQHWQRLELEAEVLLQRAPGLAEQVAQRGRDERARRAAVPPVALLLDGRQRAAELVRRLQQCDLVALLAQPGRGGQAAEAAADDDDACHGYSTSIGVAPVRASSSSYDVEKTAAGCPAAAQTTS